MSTTPLSDREQLMVNQLGLTKEITDVPSLENYFKLGSASSANQRISVLVEYKNLLKAAEAAGMDVVNAANKARLQVVAEVTRIQELATKNITSVVSGIMDSVSTEFQKLREELLAGLSSLKATSTAGAAVVAADVTADVPDAVDAPAMAPVVTTPAIVTEVPGSETNASTAHAPEAVDAISTTVIPAVSNALPESVAGDQPVAAPTAAVETTGQTIEAPADAAPVAAAVSNPAHYQ